MRVVPLDSGTASGTADYRRGSTGSKESAIDRPPAQRRESAVSRTSVPGGRFRRDGPMKIGVVSDTHGRLQSRVLESFQGVDRIFHAGDVGSDDILLELSAFAPVP